MNRASLNNETRVTLRLIMNDETLFKKTCRLFDKHKSVSLIESSISQLVQETGKASKEFLDEVDFSAIVNEFKEEN
jgi:hypothetical protein